MTELKFVSFIVILFSSFNILIAQELDKTVIITVTVVLIFGN